MASWVYFVWQDGSHEKVEVMLSSMHSQSDEILLWLLSLLIAMGVKRLAIGHSLEYRRLWYPITNHKMTNDISLRGYSTINKYIIPSQMYITFFLQMNTNEK